MRLPPIHSPYRNVVLLVSSLALIVSVGIGIAVGYNIKPRQIEPKICLALHDHNKDNNIDHVHLGFDTNRDGKFDLVRTHFFSKGYTEAPYNNECETQNILLYR